jgi:hypothetical protein
MRGRFPTASTPPRKKTPDRTGIGGESLRTEPDRGRAPFPGASAGSAAGRGPGVIPALYPLSLGCQRQFS